jgi:gas vesicle protein
MGQVSEEQLTNDIEGTRQDLSRNLDALNDKVNPSRVIERRKEATRSRIVGMKDKVMGSAQSASSGGTGVGDKMSGAKDSVAGSAQGAVQAVEQRTEGNPLAAGVIAFGAGWLISSILPASQKEADAAARLVETAKEHGQPVVDEAKSMGQDIGQNLKEKAADAAEEVKSSAQSSAENVKQEGQSSAQTVKDDAQQKM